MAVFLAAVLAPAACVGASSRHTYRLKVAAIVGAARSNARSRSRSSRQTQRFIGRCAPATHVSRQRRRRRRPMIVIGQVGFASRAPPSPRHRQSWCSWGAPALHLHCQCLRRTAHRGAHRRADRAAWTVHPLDSWQSLFVQFIAAGLGVLIGERVLSDSGAYTLIIALSIFPTIPLGLMGLGESPGWWSREPLAPQPGQDAAIKRTETRNPCMKLWSLATDFVNVRCNGSARSHCGVVLRATASGLQAFKYPPFRWLFITNTLNSCYTTIASLYFVFWFQDEVGGCEAASGVSTDDSGSAGGCVPEFTFLGHSFRTPRGLHWPSPRLSKLCAPLCSSCQAAG